MQVLGCAIVGVFALGLVKLWWTERYVRKQTVIDEEKRRTISDLRKNGQLIERKASTNVPFGVRAIESGIEVDGIWISRSNTPISESLRQVGSAGQSSTSSIASRSNISIASLTPPKPSSPAGETGSPLVRSNLAMLEHPSSTRLSPAARPSMMRPKRPEYKPKRSSHLRFSSYGSQYDEEALGRLEGEPSELPKSSRTSTSSSGSEQTMSSHGRIVKHGNMQYRPVYSQSIEEANKQARADAEESFATIVRSYNGDYSSIPSEDSSPKALPNPTPRPSPEKSSPPKLPVIPLKRLRRISTTISSADLNHSTGSQVALLSQNRRIISDEPSYGSGEVHANKVARRVNSSFQILPAGTFGPRKETETSNVALDRSGGSMAGLEESFWKTSPRNDARNGAFMKSRRVSNKLQAKPRISISEPPDSVPAGTL